VCIRSIRYREDSSKCIYNKWEEVMLIIQRLPRMHHSRKWKNTKLRNFCVPENENVIVAKKSWQRQHVLDV